MIVKTNNGDVTNVQAIAIYTDWATATPYACLASNYKKVGPQKYVIPLMDIHEIIGQEKDYRFFDGYIRDIKREEKANDAEREGSAAEEDRPGST